MKTKIESKNKNMLKILCPVCHQNEDSILFRIGTSLFPVNVSLCRYCGFIFLNPRPPEKDWNEYYETGIYDDYHRPSRPDKNIKIKSDIDKVPYERIKQYLFTSDKHSDPSLKEKNVCEIGAGTGNVICAFYGNKIFAIEPSSECRSILSERGIDNVWGSIDQAKDYHDKFDIILMRHVLEHTYDPKSFLDAIGCFLTDNGIVYVAVPNILVSKKIFIGMFTYPHISYFSIHTLQYLFRSLGYEVLAHGIDTDEIWCIASKNKHTQRNNKTDHKDINLAKNIMETKEIIKKGLYTPQALKRIVVRFISHILPFSLQAYLYIKRNAH